MYKIVSSSDWIELYKDGEKIYEGHKVYLDEIFDLLGIEYEWEWRDDE
jgi:hypothetical protein